MISVLSVSIPVQYSLLMILIYYRMEKILQLESAANSELSNISLWLKVNKLSLNIKKTHYMIFCRRKKLYHNVKLLIDRHAIDEVQKTKFLDIIIDDELTGNGVLIILPAKFHVV